MSLIQRTLNRSRREIEALRTQFMRRELRDVPTILCPSIGRVGSTMMHDCLVQGRGKYLFGGFKLVDKPRIGSFCADLSRDTIPPGTICGTHDVPHILTNHPQMKVVFLFGRPSDTVLSTWRLARRDPRWGDLHQKHMQATGSYEEMLDRDVLRLEKKIDAWLAVSEVPVLAIKYEAIWAHQHDIEAFVGFPIPLPPEKPRDFDDLDSDLVARVRNTYARLDDKVAALPPCSVRN